MTAEVDQQSLERLKQLLSDRWWRLTHLYYIVDKNGDKTSSVITFSK